MANISTPTFYRHFRGIYEVVEASHEKVDAELAEAIQSCSSLAICLFRLFHFVQNHEIYYRMNLYQMSFRPFRCMASLLEPKISAYVIPDAKQRNCYEIESCFVIELLWWIKKDHMNSDKMDTRINAILDFTKQRAQMPLVS